MTIVLTEKERKETLGLLRDALNFISDEEILFLVGKYLDFDEKACKLKIKDFKTKAEIIPIR